MTNHAPLTTPLGATPTETLAPSVVGTAPVTSTDVSNESTTHRAADAARDVAGTVSHEAGSVAREAAAQAKKLAVQARDELAEQAGTQQRRVAEGFRSAGSELSTMSDASTSDGMASNIVSAVGQRADDVADWLEQREPADLLHEVAVFARARPAVFIGIAAVVGILAGRLTRSLAAPSPTASTDPSTS